MKTEIVEADVLCVGGGIVGLMAAIHASELGAKVIVAEKANTLRSGAGAMGNDHFACYIPEAHGPDVEAVLTEARNTQMRGRLEDRVRARLWYEKTFDIIKLWDSWGIPMQYKGHYEFAGHRFPDRPNPTYLKYAGQMQKPILTRQALNRGVKIINRVMVFELLSDGCVIGAIGADTREDRIIEFRAKSVILGTGGLRRLYLGPTPGWMFNMTRGGSISGDGRAMAYRLGAELMNMEMLARHAGARYFVREGQATWVGVFRDPEGKPVGPFLTKPDRRYSDMIIEVNKDLFAEYARSGKGPIYLDGRDISDEDYEYMMYWLVNEGNVALINHLKEEGIDFRKNPVEFMTYETNSLGAIRCNNRTETSVKGLYAAGDENVGGISAAATFGWIAGENAAKYAKKAKAPDTKTVEAKIEEKKRWLDEIRGRAVGPDWKEANIALQQVMSDYTGSIRSETLLEAGLNHLRRIKEKACTTIRAKNQHELMRSLEVLNLLDLGELVFVAARERKESRGLHIRADYPFTNPLMDNKLVVVKRVDNKPVAELREKGS